MNRRTFLKQMAGYSLGLASMNLALPSSAKASLLSPVTSLVNHVYLQERIRNSLAQLKNQHPGWKFGETHCHSSFSDGHFDVHQIMSRAADLGLDYLIITEHLTAGEFGLAPVLQSIRTRQEIFRRMDANSSHPVKTYPGFEISTQQGHLILVFPTEYSRAPYLKDIRTVFGPYERHFPSMETAARWGRAMGAVSIVPHPDIERSYPFGVPVYFVRQHLTGLVDAIEDISTGHGYEERYSDKLGLASIGSSDDHFNFIIGSTVTGYNATEYQDFLSAIRARATRAIAVERSLAPLINTARSLL